MAILAVGVMAAVVAAALLGNKQRNAAYNIKYWNEAHVPQERLGERSDVDLARHGPYKAHDIGIEPF